MSTKTLNKATNAKTSKSKKQPETESLNTDKETLNTDKETLNTEPLIETKTPAKKPRAKKEKSSEEVKEKPKRAPRAKKGLKEEEEKEQQQQQLKEEQEQQQLQQQQLKEEQEQQQLTKEEPNSSRPRKSRVRNNPVKITDTTNIPLSKNYNSNNANNTNYTATSASNINYANLINNIKNINRLHIISFINFSWYIQISEFLQEHPSFNKLIPIVALDEYPNGFNKNPNEDDKDAPRNLFEIILYGLAFAGADIEYGKYQYLLMTNYFRCCDVFIEDMDMPEDAQPEKVPIYKALINKLLDEDIDVDDLVYTPEHMEIIESVEGMTECTVTLIYLLFDEVTRDRCLPYGDKQFRRGMSMFYGLENPTKAELKAITNTWTNKKVGLMFVVQYAHYSEYV